MEITQTETDQYDAVLRAMEPGLLISVNDQSPSSNTWTEMYVESSMDNRTAVDLSDMSGGYYRIIRRGDSLLIGGASDSGLSNTKEIETIEIIGMKS